MDSIGFLAPTYQMIHGNVVLQPNLSDEEIVKLYLHYKKEKEEELEKAHKHPLWQEVKDYVNSIRPEILKQIRAKIIPPLKVRENLE